MAEHSIPVDLFNPGQVFACLGFLEATDVLLDGAQGRFDWKNESDIRFHLKVSDTKTNPFGCVLKYLAGAEINAFAPIGFVPEQSTNSKEAAEDDDDEIDSSSEFEESETFPASKGDKTALPIRLKHLKNSEVTLSHWADGSGRNTFKLYSGNRSAAGILRAMFSGTREKPRKGQTTGDLKTVGLRQLWDERHQNELIKAPFHVLGPIGGSFNFDPRGAWTGLDAGYSPDEQKHPVASSPIVQILAAWGLEHARPHEFGVRQVRYSVWSEWLPPMLARVAIQERIPSKTRRTFRFELALNGKNKVVKFAQEESSS